MNRAQRRERRRQLIVDQASVAIGELKLQTDVSPGDWVIEHTRDFGCGVASLVPTTFEAYARVFHPAYRYVSDPNLAAPYADPIAPAPAETLWPQVVRWAQVAAANKRIAHPGMEWVSITGDWRYYQNAEQPGVWDQRPSEGSLARHQLGLLAALLSDYTSTPDQCWFAVWDGFGYLPFEPRGMLKIRMPQRPMLLFAGPLSAATTSLAEEPWEQSPSLWWPDDHAWCVASDVDLMTTYVGAGHACIEALVNSSRLEALAVSVEQQVTFDTDEINPPPTGLGPHHH